MKKNHKNKNHKNNKTNKTVAEEVLSEVCLMILKRDHKVDDLRHDRRLLNETALDRMISKENDRMLADLRNLLKL